MLTNHLTFLHFPRTGGTTFRRVLGRVPGLHVYSGATHRPYNTYADICKLEGISVPPAVIFVRNPWDWYASQWRWQRRTKGVKEIAPFYEWLQGVGEIVGQPMSSLPAVVLLNHAPATYVWRYLQGDKAAYIGRFEDYENEVVRILLAVLPKGLVDETWIRTKLHSAGRLHSTENSSYQDYYTDETHEWIAQWDEEFIGRFGYDF